MTTVWRKSHSGVSGGGGRWRRYLTTLMPAVRAASAHRSLPKMPQSRGSTWQSVLPCWLTSSTRAHAANLGMLRRWLHLPHHPLQAACSPGACIARQGLAHCSFSRYAARGPPIHRGRESRCARRVSAASAVARCAFACVLGASVCASAAFVAVASGPLPLRGGQHIAKVSLNSTGYARPVPRAQRRA